MKESLEIEGHQKLVRMAVLEESNALMHELTYFKGLKSEQEQEPTPTPAPKPK